MWFRKGLKTHAQPPRIRYVRVTWTPFHKYHLMLFKLKIPGKKFMKPKEKRLSAMDSNGRPGRKCLSVWEWLNPLWLADQVWGRDLALGHLQQHSDSSSVICTNMMRLIEDIPVLLTFSETSTGTNIRFQQISCLDEPVQPQWKTPQSHTFLAAPHTSPLLLTRTTHTHTLADA